MLSAWRFFERVWVPALICAVSIVFVVEAQALRGDGGKFPTVVGALSACLAFVELVLQAFAPKPQSGLASDADPSWAEFQKKVLLALWFVLTLGAFYVVGVLAAIAISAALYHLVFARRGVVWAFVFGLSHAVFFWVAFDLLAGFQLYGGVLA